MSYERRDASEKIIGITALILAGLVWGSIGVSAWMYHARNHGPGVPPSAGRQTSFTHGADERIGILEDYGKMVRESEQHLDGYGWVDQKAGVARIPIERAMALTTAGVKPAPAPKPPVQVP